MIAEWDNFFNRQVVSYLRIKKDFEILSIFLAKSREEM